MGICKLDHPYQHFVHGIADNRVSLVGSRPPWSRVGLHPPDMVQMRLSIDRAHSFQGKSPVISPNACK